MRSKVREHARPSPASTAKWRPRLARWRSWRPGGKRSRWPRKLADDANARASLTRRASPGSGFCLFHHSQPAWLLLPQASAAGAVHARLASRTSCGGSSDGERLVLALGYGRRWRRCHCHSALQPLLFAERNERREVPHDLVRVASLHV
eukprot:tig00000056_g24054.t1